jgi:peptidoglycan/LPS O-acetylase OafA/YrhL
VSERATQEHQSGRSARYVPGLDGLRAIAVVGVLLYHAQVHWLPGGFLGVDLFFVISGYLITTLLIAEFQTTGRINFKAFYLRRARRLLPALLAMLTVLVAFMAAFHPTALHETRGDVFAALGYFSNWWYVLHHVSYFVASGRQPPLQHLWSLGIEEQFYLGWPPLLALLIFVGRRGGRRLALIIGVALAGAIASSLWMATLAVRGNVPFDTDSSRLYFGTDTHASGLLIGAAGAAVVVLVRRAARRQHLAMSATTAAIADGLGAACLLAFCWLMHALTEFSPGLYRGGFLGLAVLAAVAIIAVSVPGSRLGAVLGVGPLRWIGRRSYGLYLWHWPVFVFTRPGLDWPVHGMADLAARLAITVALTEASFRLVEEPIRSRGVRQWLAPLLPTGDAERHLWRTALPVLASASAVAVVVAGGSIVVGLANRSVRPTKTVAAQLVASPPGSVAASSPAPASITPAVAQPSPVAAPTPSHVSAPSAPVEPSPSFTPKPIPKPHSHASSTIVPGGAKASSNASGVPAGPAPALTALGDSVMVDAAATLSSICAGTEVHAVVGWQAAAVFGELDELQAAHHVGRTVIIETGTNGIVSSKELDAALTSLATAKRVVVVNDHMARAWEPPNNAMFPKVVAKHPNAVLVDWDTLANTHPEYLAADGVHLQAAGRVAYASALQKAAGCGAAPSHSGTAIAS